MAVSREHYFDARSITSTSTFPITVFFLNKGFRNTLHVFYLMGMHGMCGEG